MAWDNFLLDILLRTPEETYLLEGRLATRVRRLSTFLDELSTDFISLHMKRSITNIYHFYEEPTHANHVGKRTISEH